MTRHKSKRDRRAHKEPEGTSELLKAVRLLQKARFADAERVCQGLLKVSPESPQAHHLYGRVLFRLGRLEDAITSVARAVALDPRYAAAHNDLGNLLDEAGRTGEAEIAYRWFVALEPSSAMGFKNLGDLLARSGKSTEAADAFRLAVSLEPSSATYQRLIHALQQAGDMNGGIEVLRQWARHAPENPVPRHLLAARTGMRVPPRATGEYVREVFDAFADRFDDDLARLHYRGPQLIGDAIAPVLGPPSRKLDILDAGCGAGLCAPVLRPYAKRLVGVDLSPAMIAHARQLQVYDELFEDDIEVYFGRVPSAVDLIAAADTLNYFGQLDPVLTAVATALRPGGHVVFTVEREEEPCPGGDAGYRLNTSGRYSHMESYVRDGLATAGLVVRSLCQEVQRQEADQDAVALVVCAQRQTCGPHA